MNNLQDLFHHMLMDIYYAERKILKSLPKMANKTSDKTLAEIFENHRQETEKHIDRLKEVFEMMKEKPEGETCQALDGLVAEAEDILDAATTDSVRDAGLLAAAQAIEHYEIARYGTLVTWAEEIGLKSAAKVLQQTLDEEHAANVKLDKLAAKRINKEAA